MSKIFIIDDEKDFLLTVQQWGKSNGYEITIFENSDGFLDALLLVEPEIVLVDINLKTDDGRFISEDLKNILPFPIKIILISADPTALLDYHKHYADDILNKPFAFTDLKKKLNKHLKK